MFTHLHFLEKLLEEEELLQPNDKLIQIENSRNGCDNRHKMVRINESSKTKLNYLTVAVSVHVINYQENVFKRDRIYR